MDIFRGPQIYNFVLLAPKLLFLMTPQFKKIIFVAPQNFNKNFEAPY